MSSEILDEVMPHLPDVVCVVGIGNIPGGTSPVPATTMLLPPGEHLTRELPTQLGPKTMTLVGGKAEAEQQLFVLCEPGKPHEPFLMTEWDKSCDEFWALSEKLGLFLVEIWTTSRVYKGLCVKGAMQWNDLPVSRAEYDAVAKSVDEGPPEGMTTYRAGSA